MDNFSAYKITTKYLREWTTGQVVFDNAESKKDQEFFVLQAEKSTEGLSESVVQTGVQLTFLCTLSLASTISVGKYHVKIIINVEQNEIVGFLSMGADQLEDDTAQLAGSDVVRIWGKFGNIFASY